MGMGELVFDDDYLQEQTALLRDRENEERFWDRKFDMIEYLAKRDAEQERFEASTEARTAAAATATAATATRAAMNEIMFNNDGTDDERLQEMLLREMGILSARSLAKMSAESSLIHRSIFRPGFPGHIHGSQAIYSVDGQHPSLND